ncbi:MAG: hypothetical protein ACHQWU_04930 [Gemmatimonadales bacterium]
MSTNTVKAVNTYDGRDFLFLTPDPAAIRAVYIQLLDSAGLPIGAPVRIAGADYADGVEHRYDLDPLNTGHVLDYLMQGGPVILKSDIDALNAPTTAFPLANPIFCKGRVPQGLPTDLVQTGSTIAAALPVGSPTGPGSITSIGGAQITSGPSAPSGTGGTTGDAPSTPVAPEPAHEVAPTKHVSTIARVLKAIPADALAAAKATEHGAEDAFHWLERHL